VFHYSGKPYVSTIPNQDYKAQSPEVIGTSVQPYQSIPKGLEHFGESQVNNIFRPVNYPASQINFNNTQNPPPSQNTNQSYQKYPV
jgi:hypothetical protein